MYYTKYNIDPTILAVTCYIEFLLIIQYIYLWNFYRKQILKFNIYFVSPLQQECNKCSQQEQTWHTVYIFCSWNTGVIVNTSIQFNCIVIIHPRKENSSDGFKILHHIPWKLNYIRYMQYECTMVTYDVKLSRYSPNIPGKSKYSIKHLICTMM